MNREKHDKLIRFMEEKPELQEKLNEMAKENSIDFNEKIITELNNAGFQISMDDLMEPSGELSEDELRAVAGGGGCACALGGYGGGDRLYCACLFAGSGGIDNCDNVTGQGGCVCPIAGTGATNWG